MTKKMTKIKGDLYISKTGSKTWDKTMDLSELEEVMGNLHISEDISLPNLNRVGGMLGILGNADLPKLEAVEGRVLIQIRNLALPSLKSIGGTLNCSLSGPLPAAKYNFDKLEYVGGHLYYEGENPLPALKKVGDGFWLHTYGPPHFPFSLYYDNCEAPAPKLEEIGGELHYKTNGEYTFPSLRRVGKIRCKGSEGASFPLLENADFIKLEDTKADFPALKSVNKLFSADNCQIKIPALENAGEVCLMQGDYDCPALRNIEGPFRFIKSKPRAPKLHSVSWIDGKTVDCVNIPGDITRTYR